MRSEGFSRDHVQQAERMAWAKCNGRDYYFDGTYFWLNKNGSRWALRAQQTPEQGWWHREDCNCPLCRSGEEDDRLNEWLAESLGEMSWQ